MGKVLHTFHGVHSEHDYRQALTRLLPSQNHPLLRDAICAVQSDRADQALERLAEATREHPTMAEYPLLAVKILIRGKDYDQALAVVKRTKAVPDCWRYLRC